MKRLCLSLFVVFLSLLMVGCDLKSKSPARLQVKENHWSFGSVIVGDKLNHVFTLKNIGGKTLHIKGFEADCACTAAAPSKTTLHPDETTHLKVSLDTTDREGKLIKQVAIFSDDPVSPTTSVTVEADIFPLFTVTPKYIHFGSIAKKTVTVSSRREINLQIEQIESSTPRLSAVLSKTMAEGSDVLQTVQVNVNGDIPIKPLDVTETVTIHTNLQNHKEIQIPVRIHLGQQVTIQPAKLFFGVVKQGAEKIRQATLSIPMQPGLQIERVQCQQPFLVPTVTQLAPGRYELNAKLSSTAPIGRFRDEIKVYTTNSDIFLSVEAQGFIIKR